MLHFIIAAFRIISVYGNDSGLASSAFINTAINRGACRAAILLQPF